MTAVATNIPLTPMRLNGLSQVQRRLETLGTETE